MKTVDSYKESNSCSNTPNKTNDSKRGQSYERCNKNPTGSRKGSKTMGHKGQNYERISSTNGVTQDSRSQSLPNRLDEKNKLLNGVAENCDKKVLLLNESPPSSPTNDLWFKTWPERCEKVKSGDSSPDITLNGNTKADEPTKCDSNMTNGNTQRITLNDALKNISLAYSPVTKQLHIVETNPVQLEDSDHLAKAKHGHKRNEPGSFSSTVSSLSDPSPSGSLLEADDRSSPTICDSDAKNKRKGFTTFFNRNVFSWKTGSLAPVNNSSVWKIFSKSHNEAQVNSSPQHENVVASSTALIQHMRPSNLPAKTLEEEQRHRDEYRAMLAAAKKKEALNSAAKQKQQKLQLQNEEQQALSAKHFINNVLPSWDSMYNTRKTRDLWWLGLPSSVRGKVWRLAIGNELNLTQQLYEICLSRAQTRLNSPEPSKSDSEIDQESSMDVIQLDISRTFPNLCIFQEGGPYSEILHSLLAAYVCYRPDVGYVQGMSYIAAILILNMEQFDAFICFANLLNRPLHIAAFTLNQVQMQAYFSAFNEIFNYNLPKLYTHFECSGLTPDLYLLDWIYTIFAKAMPLDIACRVWDLFLRDGEEFIFRTALGILHLNQDLLMTMDFLHGAQFLTHLPDDLPADQLFKCIQLISTNIGKQTFSHIVDKYSVPLS